MNITNEHGDEIPIYEWNPLILRHKNNSKYTYFTNKAMKVRYTIIHGIDLPRIPNEGKEWLNFNPNTKFCDLFLFKYHKVIRIYGFEGKPYEFTIRFLDMEYVKKRFVFDELHFKSLRKHKSFMSLNMLFLLN